MAYSDPSTFNLVKAIIDRLFIAEERRLKKAIEKLIVKNQEASHHKLDSFVYNGKCYRLSNQQVANKNSRTLDLSLWPEMDAILKDRDQIKLDRDLIKQLFTKIYDNCGHTGHPLQDLRDATPDCIIDVMSPEVRALQRCGPVTNFLKHPRDWREYNELLPKIEFYATVRLIY